MSRERLGKSGIWFLLGTSLLLIWSNPHVRAQGEYVQAGSPPASLSGDQVWISSVPFGLKVYAMPLGAAPTKESDEGLVRVEATHAVFEPGNLKGTTPFLLKGLPKGWIAIGVKPVTWLDRELNALAADQTLDYICLVTPLAKSGTSWFNDYRKGIGELDGGAVFAIENDPQKRRYITILAVAKSSDLAVTEKQYPAEAHFVFDDEAAIRILNEKLGETQILSLDERTKALSMAHRGGKVVVTKGDVRVVLDVADRGKFTADLFISAPKK